MFWHSSPVKINISQGFLLDKHKNLSQEGACFGIVVESTRHYLKHSASNNIELQNVTTDLVSMNDEGQRGAKGFKDSILKYFSDLFFSYCFDKNEFDSSDKSWSAKIARKITSDNSRNFAQRIEMYHHLQFTKAFSDLRTLFRLNLKDSKNVSLIDLIFGAANSGFVNESISVDLSLETLNSRHAINIIKEKNGGYLVRDPNSGEFKHTETKERADKVIRDLLISYENINNSFWDLLCGRVNIREFLFEENLDKNLMYCVTPIDKLLKKIGIVDENGIPKSSVEKYAINFNLEGLSESEKEEKLEKFIRIEDAILAEDNEVLKSEFSVSGSEEFTSAIYPDGSNLIWFAAQHGKFNVIETLIACGCTPTLLGECGRTILDVVIEENSAKLILKSILESDGEKGINEVGSVLYDAVINQKKEIVELILKYAPDSAKIIAPNGQTPLYRAVMMSNEKEIVELILKYAPDSAKITDKDGKTILSIEIAQKEKEMVELILKYAPDSAKITDYQYGYTALHWAICSQDKEMINLLLQTDKSLADIENNEGESPIKFAKYLEEIEHWNIRDIIEILESYEEQESSVAPVDVYVADSSVVENPLAGDALHHNDLESQI